MNQTIVDILQEFNLEDYQPIIQRDLDLGDPLPPRKGNLVKVVKGMRRSGKSYRLLQEMAALINRQVPPSRICYFSFEDVRLGKVTPQTGDEVITTFKALFNPSGNDGLYLFFDEIQEMDDWGPWLRHVVDSEKATIYVSGSSSRLLSDEISTEFRGRALEFELLPYSFGEALRASGNPFDANGGKEMRARTEMLLPSYLQRGGFPAAQGLPASQAVPLLQSYARQVVSRDVVDRHNLARPQVATQLARRMLAGNSRQLSAHKLLNDLRSLGISTSRELISTLISHFEEAYLVFSVSELSRSIADVSTRPKKVYAIDPGIALANSPASALYQGHSLEDAVYLELRRQMAGSREGSIASLTTKRHGYEVDFVVGDALLDSVSRLVQVCVGLDDEKTFERETRALWEAMEERDIPEAELVVMNGPERDHSRDGMVIHQIPAWRWLLGH